MGYVEGPALRVNTIGPSQASEGGESGTKIVFVPNVNAVSLQF